MLNPETSYAVVLTRQTHQLNLTYQVLQHWQIEQKYLHALFLSGSVTLYIIRMRLSAGLECTMSSDEQRNEM